MKLILFRSNEVLDGLKQGSARTMVFIIKAIGGITALILLVITLLGSLITLGGLLLGAIKILIVVIFIAVLVMIVFSILRDRSRRRNEVSNI